MRASALAVGVVSVVLGVVAATSPASAWEVLDAIDEAHRAGEIDADLRIVYRVAAVRAPDRLPERFRRILAASAERPRCETPVLVDAFQSLPRLRTETRGTVLELLDPGPDLDYSVESLEPFPVRVGYEAPHQEDMALRVLEAAEHSFEEQVQRWGYWAPPIEPDVELYRFYVTSAEGAAGYTAPYAENHDTPRMDAFTYIVIDPINEGGSIDTTVAHELNHAAQIGMDLSELASFMENTATAVEVQVYPEDMPMLVLGIFPLFQSQPWQPLEYKLGLSTTDGYEYGGALWTLFLTHIYGGDDPTFLRRVWEGTVQEGWVNEPDSFDVLNELLAVDGGTPAATRAFAEHRFFVGDNADGQHWADAARWRGAEPWVSASWSTSLLPLVDQGPRDPDTLPRPNGCNYVVLDVDAGTVDAPLRFTFRGETTVPWDVHVIAVGGAGQTVSSAVSLGDDGAGDVSVPVGDRERFVLTICQHPGADYDPDERRWPDGDYRYDIEQVVPAPTVTSVEPALLERGAHGVQVTITGTGFVDDEELSVGVSGDGVLLRLEERVSSELLRATAVVAPAAPLGPRDVTVTNPGGATGVAPAAITIVDAFAPDPDAGPDAAPPGQPQIAGGGCSCGLSGSRHGGAGFGWMIGLVLIVGLARRRGALPCRTEDELP